MNQKDFDKLLDRRIELIRKALAAKNAEYATDIDKLHNFKRAGEVLQCSPEKALIGFWIKQVTSILDIIDDLEKRCGINKDCFPDFYPEEYVAVLDEKTGDAINYLILLEVLIQERYENMLIMELIKHENKN